MLRNKVLMMFIRIILIWNTVANEYQTPKWKRKVSLWCCCQKRKRYIACKYLCDMYIVAYKWNFWSCRMKCWRVNGLWTLRDCYLLGDDSVQINRNTIHYKCSTSKWKIILCCWELILSSICWERILM